MSELESRFREIDRWEGGAGWIAHPEAAMQRASHALLADGQVWLVDPVDAPGLDEFLADLGDVAGVVVCLDRHKRDAAKVANRHGVAVYLPRRVAGIAAEIGAPVEIVDDKLGDTGFHTVTIVDNPIWSEVALHRAEDGTLLVPEAVGTAPYYLAEGERLGVHPALRLTPPRRVFSGFHPDRLFVGHGEGIMDGASTALRTAFRDARSNAPRLYWRTLREFVGV